MADRSVCPTGKTIALRLISSESLCALAIHDRPLCPLQELALSQQTRTVKIEPQGTRVFSNVRHQNTTKAILTHNDMRHTLWLE
jgi:hypothetical protein